MEPDFLVSLECLRIGSCKGWRVSCSLFKGSRCMIFFAWKATWIGSLTLDDVKGRSFTLVTDAFYVEEEELVDHSAVLLI